MTNLEQVVAEMDLDAGARRRLAAELLRLRRIESECRRHRRRLPHQVQSALAAEPHVYDLDPPTHEDLDR